MIVHWGCFKTGTDGSERDKGRAGTGCVERTRWASGSQECVGEYKLGLTGDDQDHHLSVSLFPSHLGHVMTQLPTKEGGFLLDAEKAWGYVIMANCDNSFSSHTLLYVLLFALCWHLMLTKRHNTLIIPPDFFHVIHSPALFLLCLSPLSPAFPYALGASSHPLLLWSHSSLDNFITLFSATPSSSFGSTHTGRLAHTSPFCLLPLTLSITASLLGEMN